MRGLYFHYIHYTNYNTVLYFMFFLYSGSKFQLHNDRIHIIQYDPSCLIKRIFAVRITLEFNWKIACNISLYNIFGIF